MERRKWGIKMIPLSSIKKNPNNPRIIKDTRFKSLVKSIKEFSKMLALRPIVVDDSGIIIGGNMRYEALRAAGYEEIPEEWVKKTSELTEEEKRRFIILDNNEFGEWGWDELANQYDIDELTAWGVDEKDLIGRFDLEKDGLTDADAVPSMPIDAKCKPGDLWIMDGHRLVCGDSTNPQHVEKLMAGEKAVLMNTDPPYGIAYDSTASKPDGHKRNCPWETIENDMLVGDKIQPFLESCFSVIQSIALKDNAAWYLWHAHLTGAFFAAAAAAADILLHRQIIWVKPRFILGMGQYHWSHEPCFMGWKRGFKPPFYGARNQTTVWNIDYDGKKNPVDRVHPTQKPVEIFKIPITNHALANEIICEPFAGSGSQFIAAEQLSRRCFGIEISPAYCDVILKRWADFTGKDPVRDDGVIWSSLNA